MGQNMIEQKLFGQTPDGKNATLYTISNENGMKASVTDYGAILVNLWVPDRNGTLDDVVLGYDSLKEYTKNPHFYGAVIGPSANRIAGATFQVDGVTYHLDINERNNNLHSHKELGYHKRLWETRTYGNCVEFTLTDEDGSMGFPGNKQLQVTYTLDKDNGLEIHYHGKSDRNTVLNFTNHSYFNLNGHQSGEVSDHKLFLKASQYTPIAADSIPTGELAQVTGTPMDFTQPYPIGMRIDAEFEQLKLTGGYDHNWVIDNWNGEPQHFATVWDPSSKRVMKVFTTLPGVQLYVGDFKEGSKGKEGAVYKNRCSFCLETQYFPNSVNQPNFPSCIFGPDQDYDSVTIYRFENDN